MAGKAELPYITRLTEISSTTRLTVQPSVAMMT